MTLISKLTGPRASPLCIAPCAQGETAKDVARWLADLRWRVMASEQEIKRRNEPQRGQTVELSRLDETETAVHRPPQRVMGISVRYEERPEVEASLGDEL